MVEETKKKNGGARKNRCSARAGVSERAPKGMLRAYIIGIGERSREEVESEREREFRRLLRAGVQLARARSKGSRKRGDSKVGADGPR